MKGFRTRPFMIIYLVISIFAGIVPNAFAVKTNPILTIEMTGCTNTMTCNASILVGEAVTFNGSLTTKDGKPIADATINIVKLTPKPALITLASAVTDVEGRYDVSWIAEFSQREKVYNDVTSKFLPEVVLFFAQFEGSDELSAVRSAKLTAMITANQIFTFIHAEKRIYSNTESALIFINFVDMNDEFIDPDSVRAVFDYREVEVERKKPGTYVLVTPVLTVGHHQVMVMPDKQYYNLGNAFLTVPVSPITTTVAPQTSEVRTIKFCLKEVSFTNDQNIRVDSENPMRDIVDPVWKDENCDKVAEKNEPVAYIAGQKMKIEVELQVTIEPPLDKPQSVMIRATSDTLFTFGEEIELKNSAESIMLTVESEDGPNKDGTLEKKAHYFDKMNLKWSVDGFSGDSYTLEEEFAESSHLIYVTFRRPATTVYLTLLDLTSRNADGEKKEGDVVEKIWQEFTDRIVNRRQLDSKTGSVIPENDPMSYWKPGHCPTPESCPADPRAMTPCHQTTDGVLAHKDGRCGGWAEFFKSSLAIHGIRSTVFTVWPISGYLLVPNWLFKGAGTSGDKDWPWNFTVVESDHKFTSGGSSEVIDEIGVPAQGSDDPQAIFDNHAIVRYGGKFYDPSYGTGPFDDCSEWELSSMVVDPADPSGGYLDKSFEKARKDDPKVDEVRCV